MVAAPVAAAVLAVRVSVLVEVAGFGLKEAVTPFGNPEAASITLPENPSKVVMVIVLVTVFPCTTLNVFGAAESV